MQAYLLSQGKLSRVQTRREDFRPYHSLLKTLQCLCITLIIPTWDSSPQDLIPPHCTNYNPSRSPSCSFLSSHVAILFQLAKHEPNSGPLHLKGRLEDSLLDLQMVGSICSGLSWSVLSVRPFPNNMVFYHLPITSSFFVLFPKHPMTRHFLVCFLQQNVSCMGVGPICVVCCYIPSG